MVAEPGEEYGVFESMRRGGMTCNLWCCCRVNVGSLRCVEPVPAGSRVLLRGPAPVSPGFSDVGVLIKVTLYRTFGAERDAGLIRAL